MKTITLVQISEDVHDEIIAEMKKSVHSASQAAEKVRETIADVYAESRPETKAEKAAAVIRWQHFKAQQLA